MLIRLTDTKGNDVWVNPAYVRYVRRHGAHTEVMVQVTSKWGVPGPLQTDMSPEQVVEILNAAMPGFAHPAWYEAEADEERARSSD